MDIDVLKKCGKNVTYKRGQVICQECEDTMLTNWIYDHTFFLKADHRITIIALDKKALPNMATTQTGTNPCMRGLFPFCPRMMQPSLKALGYDPFPYYHTFHLYQCWIRVKLLWIPVIAFDPNHLFSVYHHH